MENVIFGCSNSWIIFNNLKNIKEISKYSNVTIFTTNKFRKSEEIEKKLSLWKKSSFINDYFIFEKYSNNTKLSLFKIIKTYLKFNFKFKNVTKYKLCILDGNVDAWQRLITEKLIDKDCKLIAFCSDFLNIDLNALEDFYSGSDIKLLVKQLHKLRQFKDKKLSVVKINFRERVSNIKNNLFDKIDRKFLSKIFFNKTFNYREYDINTWFDTSPTSFDEILTYFKSTKLFYKKLYTNVDVSQIVMKPEVCKCNGEERNKILYISSGAPIYTQEIHQKRKKNLLKKGLQNILEMQLKILKV
tara:strand:- start:1111 stop:2013 length:903 start_codon:yes stop_codon:yes gene_type:complete